MHDGAVSPEVREEYYTLLCVRADGVASVVDLIAAAEMPRVRDRAQALLREHRSCDTVEVWREGSLVEKLTRH